MGRHQGKPTFTLKTLPELPSKRQTSLQLSLRKYLRIDGPAPVTRSRWIVVIASMPTHPDPAGRSGGRDEARSPGVIGLASAEKGVYSSYPPGRHFRQD
jgi:hypothetical protein